MRRKQNITSTRMEQEKYKIKKADTSWTGKLKVTRPIFDGKRKYFQTWWTKFKAYTNVAGFADLLKSQKSNKLPTMEANTIGTTKAKE